MDQRSHPSLAWTYLMKESYHLYGRRFWTFFRIALSPFLIAYSLRSALIFTIWWLRGGGAWLHEPLSLRTLALSAGIPFVQNGSYWLISATFFAAVASNIHHDGGIDDRLPLHDAYSLVRKRLGALLACGGITWTVMQLC